MNRFLTYVTSVGFHGVESIPSSKPRAEIRCFTFEGFSPEQVKHAIGKPKVHVPDLFCWRISRDMALRVDSKRKIIVLGNGERAVRALLKSVKARKEE